VVASISQRKELIVDEGNAIATVDLRGEIFPSPFEEKAPVSV
jgi:hypothetical protein